MKVIFFAYSEGIGLTYHLTNMALEFAKRDVKLLVVHNGIEQNPGLLQLLSDADIRSLDIDKVDINSFFDSEGEEWVGAVIHCQGFRQVDLITPFKSKFSLNIAVAMNAYRHGKWYRHIFANILRLKYRTIVDVWLFLSATALSDFCKFLPFNLNSAVIPLGVDYLTTPRREPVSHCVDILSQKQHTYSKKNQYIFYLAQFHKHKKHDELLTCFREVSDRLPHVNLVLMGNGSEIKSIEKMAVNLGIRNSVLFLGRIDRFMVEKHLLHANLAIVISKNETFGHNIVEPLALGIPVISTPVGIAHTAIQDYENGFILPSISSDGLTDKALLLLGDDGVKLNASLSNSYSWPCVVNKCINLYMSMIKG